MSNVVDVFGDSNNCFDNFNTSVLANSNKQVIPMSMLNDNASIIDDEEKRISIIKCISEADDKTVLQYIEWYEEVRDISQAKLNEAKMLKYNEINREIEELIAKKDKIKSELGVGDDKPNSTRKYSKRKYRTFVDPENENNIWKGGGIIPKWMTKMAGYKDISLGGKDGQMRPMEFAEKYLKEIKD